jgi:hypothetical protein
MADTKISALAAGSAITATDVFPAVETAGVGPVAKTAAQIKTWVTSANFVNQGVISLGGLSQSDTSQGSNPVLRAGAVGGFAITRGDDTGTSLHLFCQNVQTASNGLFLWNSITSNYGTLTPDTGLARNAAGVVEINNSTPGIFRDIKARNVITSPLTVATLVAAATAGAGARSFVTDATVTTFMTTVVGGGANAVPVVSDGTNWKIG